MIKLIIVKVVVYISYLVPTIALSLIVPGPMSAILGFAFAILAQWAWKVLIKPNQAFSQDMIDAAREFVGAVYIMRQAQKCYDTVPEGKYLIRKLEMEGRVDEDLKILVSSDMRKEYEKEEVSNG